MFSILNCVERFKLIEYQFMKYKKKISDYWMIIEFVLENEFAVYVINYFTIIME